MAQPCSTNGASSPYHAVYTCDLTRSGGYLGKAVWDTDGNSTYTASSQYVHYRDLQGNLHGIPSNHEVSIGKEPILLEGTETVSTGSTGTQTQGSAFKLTSISPSSVKAGSADFTLTVSGSGFIHGAIVSWNGSGRFRTYVNNTTMTARISARDVAAAGTARLTVTNPIPGEAVPQSGCGCPTTNAITLTITP
jgi:hypothetical protein